MKRHIEIFNIDGQETMSACGSGSCSTCASGCDTGFDEMSITELAAAFNSRYSSHGSITRHVLGEDNLVEVAQRLQEVYEDSGESLIITEGNIRFILSRLAPVLAVDGRLVSVNYIPEPDELVDYLQEQTAADA